MARRTKEEANQTREQLLDAAERIFLEKGVGAASLEEIATAAGLTRGAVYWHFENKLAIFDAMYERVRLPIDQMFERPAAEDPLGALKSRCIHVLRSMDEDEHVRRVFTILLFKCEQNDAFKCSFDRLEKKRRVTLARFESVFTHAQEHGELSSSLTAQAAAIALHAYMTGLCRDYLGNYSQYDMTELAPSLIESFFQGMLR